MKNLWLFLKERKKLVLLPIVVVILLTGVLIAFSSHAAIAPFIYAIF